MFQQGNRYEDDEDRAPPGSFKIPDRDYYRRNFTNFSTAANYLDDRFFRAGSNEMCLPQPNYSSLVNLMTPYRYLNNPADGICMRFLKRGFTKPNRATFNAAVWSADDRWLVLGTQFGDLALWESEALKVNKIISIPAHKELHPDGERIKEHIPITAMALKRYGNVLVTGDNRGVIQFCDETFRNMMVIKNSHSSAVRGLSFSPLDTRLASCGEDANIHIWALGRDRPELVMQGHQSEIKSIDWHPSRSLIVTGSRDNNIKLWDPKQGSTCVSTITAHKRSVNSCVWNQNGYWLASGSQDGLVKVYDIRTMREIEVWRGQNSEVCRIAWHPVHETLLVSGGYNGSLMYWICGGQQTPHSIIGDAHRQSIDLISWHHTGNLLATASHDCLLKFWCREPAGSKLEPTLSEINDVSPPVYMYGPLPIGTSYVQVRQMPMQQQGGGAMMGQRPPYNNRGPPGGNTGAPRPPRQQYNNNQGGAGAGGDRYSGQKRGRDSAY